MQNNGNKINHFEDYNEKRRKKITPLVAIQSKTKLRNKNWALFTKKKVLRR